MIRFVVRRLLQMCVVVVVLSMLVFLCCPLFGLAALWVLDHLREVLRSWADWRAVGNRRGQLPDLVALRAELVDEVTTLSA